MNDFETMIDAFERIGFIFQVYNWSGLLNEKMIDDLTNDIHYWFRDDKLYCVVNQRELK